MNDNRTRFTVGRPVRTLCTCGQKGISSTISTREIIVFPSIIGQRQMKAWSTGLESDLSLKALSGITQRLSG